MQVNCSTRKLNIWQRMFYLYIRCPKCQAKMKKIDWPYEPGWECPNENCKHLVWEELPMDKNYPKPNDELDIGPAYEYYKGGGLSQ